jgi:hypothetical protein
VERLRGGGGRWFRKSSIEGDGDDNGVTSRRKTTRLSGVFQGQVVGNRNQEEGDNPRTLEMSMLW